MFLLAVFGGELFVRRNCSSVSIHPVLTDVTGHRESSLSPDLSSRISSAGTASFQRMESRSSAKRMQRWPWHACRGFVSFRLVNRMKISKRAKEDSRAQRRWNNACLSYPKVNAAWHVGVQLLDTCCEDDNNLYPRSQASKLVVIFWPFNDDG